MLSIRPDFSDIPPIQWSTAALFPGAGLIAHALAAAFIAVGLFSALTRSYHETFHLAFSPASIIPSGHQMQVNIVKAQVPEGAAVLYVMNEDVPWQRGLWERSLYTHARVWWALGPSEVEALRREAALRGDPFKYALVVEGYKPDLGFTKEFELPPYPESRRVHFGMW